MKTNTLPTVSQIRRRKDGCLVTIQNPPSRAKRVWQVCHGTQSARVSNWFETKGAAVRFAKGKAVPCNSWEEIFVTSYAEEGAIRFRGELLGHRNA